MIHTVKGFGTVKKAEICVFLKLSPEYLLEGQMLKLKLQYFGHLIQSIDSFEKTLMLERLKAGGAGDDRGWDGWMASPTQWRCVWVNSGNWWWTGRPGVQQSMGSQRVRRDWVTELNWTILWADSLKSLSVCVLSFPGNLNGKESAYSAGDLGWIPGLTRYPWEGNDNPLYYSCLENSMDREAYGL